MIEEGEHVFKLDVAKDISDEPLEQLCDSGTDAIVIGGTDGITLDGELEWLYRVSRYAIPAVLEISANDAIAPGFDYYFIPMVLNSKDKEWVIDIQHEAVKEYKEMMDWDEILMEGYCILNPEAKAYEKTNCRLPDEDDVISYAYMAEHIFRLPIFYMEYSDAYC